MHPVVQGHIRDHLATERLERAAHILIATPQESVPDRIGDALRHLADAGVGPAGPDAEDRDLSGQRREEPRDVGRIVLAISVDGDEHLSARGAEPRLEGSALTGVRGEGEDPQSACRLGEPAQDGGGLIARAVVDDHDLVLPTAGGGGEGGDDRHELIEEGSDRLLLVEDRDHDGDRRSGG